MPQVEVRLWRKVAEDYLLTHIITVPASVGLHGAAHRLLQACDAVPHPGLLDCALLALRAKGSLSFNPFLSDAALGRLQSGARQWLQVRE